jgi:plastocyanin
MTTKRAVGVVLVTAAAVWVSALGGVGAGFLSDDPPRVNPYATASTTTLAPTTTLAAAPTTTSAPATTTTPASSTTVASGPGPVITITGFTFGGATEATVGQEIAVSNEGSSAHTWTARDASFDSGTIRPGDTFAFTFTQAGTFDYFCRFHEGMQGTITVTG